MRNPAAYASRDTFNPFTEMLLSRIQNGERVWVKLRDGRISPIDWLEEIDDDSPYSHFFYKSGTVYFIWNNDGTSITSTDFDIMEDVEI